MKFIHEVKYWICYSFIIKDSLYCLIFQYHNTLSLVRRKCEVTCHARWTRLVLTGQSLRTLYFPIPLRALVGFTISQSAFKNSTFSVCVCVILSLLLLAHKKLKLELEIKARYAAWRG